MRERPSEDRTAVSPDDRERVTASSGGTKPRGRRWYKAPLKLAISSALIAWILRDVALEEVFGAITSAQLGLVAVAFLLYGVGYAISITRWRLLLRAQSVTPPLFYLFQSYATGVFFNNVLPSTIGGDTVRAYDTWKIGADRVTAVMVIAMDRFLGVAALLLFALFGLLAFPTVATELPGLWTWLLALAVTMAAVVALLLKGRVPGWLRRSGENRGPMRTLLHLLRRIQQALRLFARQRRTVAWCLALSLLLQANVILHYVLVAAALALPVPPLYFVIVMPITLIVIMVPITINGIGIRENVLVFLLGLFGVAPSLALGFAWLAYGLQLVQALGAGIVYLFRRRVDRPREGATAMAREFSGG